MYKRDDHMLLSRCYRHAGNWTSTYTVDTCKTTDMSKNMDDDNDR